MKLMVKSTALLAGAAIAFAAAGPLRAQDTAAAPETPEAASDVSAAYRWSKNLQTFNANGATDGEGTKVDFTAQPNTPTAGTTTVTATVTGTSTGRLFVDVEVTQGSP